MEEDEVLIKRAEEATAFRHEVARRTIERIKTGKNGITVEEVESFIERQRRLREHLPQPFLWQPMGVDAIRSELENIMGELHGIKAKVGELEKQSTKRQRRSKPQQDSFT